MDITSLASTDEMVVFTGKPFRTFPKLVMYGRLELRSLL
jgi:hypothetical protein